MKPYETLILSLLLAATSEAAVTVQQYGAMGDGVTNDAPAFQRALQSGQEVHVPRGTYVLQGTINLTGGNTLIGENNPILLVGSGPTFAIYSLNDWVTVSGFRIDGRNQGADVFLFQPNTYEVRISKCDITRVHTAFRQGNGAVGEIRTEDIICSATTAPPWYFPSSQGSGIWIIRCANIPLYAGIGSLYFIGYGGINIENWDSWAFPQTPKIGGWDFSFFNCYDIKLNTVTMDGLGTGGALFSNCSNIIGIGVETWGIFGTGLEFITTQRASFSSSVLNYGQASGIILYGSSLIAFQGTVVGNTGLGVVVCAGSTDNTFDITSAYNGVVDDGTGGKTTTINGSIN